MRKVYIALSLIAIILLGINYYFHQEKVAEIEPKVEEQNRIRESLFLAVKDSVFTQFQESYPDHQNIIQDFYSNSDAAVVKDTTVNTFLFFSSLPVTNYQENYLSCLTRKSEFEVRRLNTEKELDRNLENLAKRYGEDFDFWFNQVGKQKFLNTSQGKPECGKYFTAYQKYSVNQTALDEFQDLLSKYRTDREANTSVINRNEQEFISDLNAVRNNLNDDGKRYLNNHLDRDEIIESTKREYIYTGEIIGSYEYSFPTKIYHREKLETLANQAVEEQYKNNLLSHGSKPYAYCFGSYNNCDGYNCSQVEVQASYSSDVLVTLKSDGRVVRHAYISAGREFTFEVHNGSYQPFFYSGSGWNPEKVMKETSCGILKGGFVSDENVGKDSPQYLSNEILTYELIVQPDGNFQTRPSSTNEAF